MSPELKILMGFLGMMVVVNMNWKWIFLLLWKFLGLFRSKGTRIKFEAKSEAVIAEERKHLEELKAEIRRLEGELRTIAPQITKAIQACNGHGIIALNQRRNELRDKWDAARHRLDSYERYIAQGR